MPLYSNVLLLILYYHMKSHIFKRFNKTKKKITNLLNREYILIVLLKYLKSVNFIHSNFVFYIFVRKLDDQQIISLAMNSISTNEISERFLSWILYLLHRRGSAQLGDCNYFNSVYHLPRQMVTNSVETNEANWFDIFFQIYN